MSKISEAMIFAIEAHKGQKRDDGEDYIVHPAQVAMIIQQVTDDPDIIAAAWLHDVIEDTPVSYEVIEARFGKRVADLVMEVTHEVGAKHIGNYFPRLKTKEGIMLKFADRLSNLSDMKAWDQKRQEHYLRKSKFWKSEP